jgi:DNA-binding Lrp family transcriptional regulator
MIDWWAETDNAVLECLRKAGPMNPRDLADRIGISEGEATAFLCMLAAEGRVRIRLVELNAPARRMADETGDVTDLVTSRGY